MKNLRFLLVVVVVACGGITTNGTPATIPGQPPPQPGPDDTVPAGTTTTTFAIDRLFLGERPRDGAPTNTAWKAFGYDLDHKDTTKTSTNVCTLAEGSPTWNQVDGNDGIDNAWGSVVMPILETSLSMPSPTDVVSNAIDSGATTLELVVTGLPSDSFASALGLSASAFVGAAVPAASFDASAPWPVDSSSLADGATLASGANVRFDAAYVNHGTFVSGPSASPLALVLPLVTTPIHQTAPTTFMLRLSIHDAVVTFDRTTGDAVSGTIAGVLDVSEFVSAARDLATRVDAELCTDSTALAGISAQLVEAADIQVDGSNEPGARCGGISIGLGFEARRIANPVAAAQSPPAAAACN